jgi:hypothetical protein
MDDFLRLVQAMQEARVRFVLIGVGGANYYAARANAIFTTQDRDLFLPLDPSNELRAWHAAESVGFELWRGNEPLGKPMDDFLAERVVERRMLVTAITREIDIDLSLTMADFDFETVWREHHVFQSEGVAIPVASLAHIVESKRRANREKDRLFLATHAEALRQLLGDDFKLR